jgi:hypothetical protein
MTAIMFPVNLILVSMFTKAFLSSFVYHNSIFRITA